MNTRTLVTKVKNAIAKDHEVLVSELPEDYGYRYRITNETKQLGNDVVEVGSTYFYQSQARVESRADDFKLYANSLGINVTMTPVHDNVRFNNASWPKTSWATLFYHVRIVD